MGNSNIHKQWPSDGPKIHIMKKIKKKKKSAENATPMK
jgi:hypothetical protein